MVKALLIIFPLILQTVINVRMLSIGGQGGNQRQSMHYTSYMHSTCHYVTGFGRGQSMQTLP